MPSIDRFWMQQQEDVLSEFQDKDLIVLGKATSNNCLHSHPPVSKNMGMEGAIYNLLNLC